MPRFDEIDTGLPPDRGVDEEAADHLCDIIDYMRSCGQYDWADETLAGIYDTVHDRKRATFAQQQAIRNIWYSKSDREFGDMS